MSKFLRNSALVAAVAAAALTSAPALAANPNQNATATARIFRPLTLTFVQNLDLGTVVLSGATPFISTISLSQGNVRTCDANVTCSGTTSVAMYNVAGTNSQTVTISAPDFDLSDGNGNTLPFDVDAPATVDLLASGAAGVDFSIGGSITVADTTPDGVYSGLFNVTAEYQ